jgi:hypothetical protein
VTDLDTLVAGLGRLAGLALVVAGFNFGTALLLDFNFLNQTPMAFQAFTAVGAFVGGLDSLVYYTLGKDLIPIKEM